MTAAATTKVRVEASRLAVQYHHWRLAGFPADHPYHLQLLLFEQALQEATKP